MKNQKIATFVTKCLKKKDAFQAIDSIISSDYFPKPWTDDEFVRLPEILKIANRLHSFIIHSGANGVLGLLTDYPVNIHLDEIERYLKIISAKESLRYLVTLKQHFPRRTNPTTSEQAAEVEELLKRAGLEKTAKYRKIEKCVSEFAEETEKLPEQLRNYLREHSENLVKALSDA